MTRILIVDDDPAQLRQISDLATRAGYVAVTATSGEIALDILEIEPDIAVCLLDLVMPDLDGMGVLEAMARKAIATPAIVLSAQSSPETIATAMNHGAVDFLQKPVAAERFIVTLRNVLRAAELESVLRSERHRRDGTLGLPDMVTKSPEMERVITLARKAAKSSLPVLIEGETGTGKELISRVIHGSGERSGKPFVTVNCGAIPLNLVESTLFGHKKGAFPGAVSDQPGKFQEAQNGTLFIDEIGELPLETQSKLLRALQHGEIEPLGSSRTEKVNVRVIAATSRRLLNLAKSGALREDLYYRLNVLPIYLPPLRDRREDIPALVSHFISRFSAELDKRVLGIAPSALALLKGYNWPGNVRQLENAVYRAIVLCETALLEPGDFPQVQAQLAGRHEAARSAENVSVLMAPVHIDQMPTVRRREAPAEKPAPDRFMNEDGEVAALAEVEKALIGFALEHYSGRMSRIARALGIGRSTLYRKLKEYGLEADVESDAA